MTNSKYLKENLIDPLNGNSCISITETKLIFSGQEEFKVLNNIPILIDESRSIFTVEDILKKAPTAQNSNYRNVSLKNTIRRKILPSLSIVSPHPSK